MEIMNEVGMKKSTFYNKVKAYEEGSNVLSPFYFVGHASKIGDAC
ncbi:hypothetical protein [Priestia megaterium]|nr:hypothetical protein [Priestia megaterium]